MGGPYLRLLTSDELRRSTKPRCRILEHTGMVVDHAEARDILAGAGARVDAGRNVVYFPPQLIEEKVTPHPPAGPEYHGRVPLSSTSPARSTAMSTPGTRAARPGTSTSDREHRTATLADWREFVHPRGRAPEHPCHVHAGPRRRAGATSDVHSCRVLLESQRKCFIHTAFGLQNQRYMLEMALAVAGSREALAERPFIHFMMSPISPLYLPEDDTAQLLLACEYGIPTDIPIMPVAGATAPITLAGALAQTNAEFLGTATLAQTVRPGPPVDLLLRPGRGQHAHRRGALRSSRGGHAGGCHPAARGRLVRPATAGHRPRLRRLRLRPDALPEGPERALPGAVGRQALVGAGTIEACMSIDPVQLVLDDEIVAIVRRWMRGITVDDEPWPSTSSTAWAPAASSSTTTTPLSTCMPAS